MNCQRWNESWVASLYGELEEAEQHELDSHVVDCAQCRERLDALAHSSSWLRQAAPDVPAAPRVVVLHPRSGWRSAWAFVGGAAAAAAMFATLLLLWPLQVAPPTPASGTVANMTSTPAASDEMREELALLKHRLAELESDAELKGASGEAMLSKAELQRELRAFFERQDAQRAADLRYVFEAVSAAEQRLDRNSQALTYLALRENPRVAEY